MAPTLDSPPAAGRRPQRQRFMEHLEALRKTLTGMAWAWVLGVAVVAANFNNVLLLLRAPLTSVPGAELITLSPMTGLFIGFNIVSAGGAIVAAPLIILHALKFFLPALSAQEQRVAGTVGAIAILLFAVGAVFGFAWMLPMSLQIAMAIQNAMGFKLLWSAEEYFSLVVALPLMMGAAFCIPLIVGVLVRLEILNHNALAKRWDIATLVILILAAAVTPTGDPVSFLFIAVPLARLDALALFVGRPPQRARLRP